MIWWILLAVTVILGLLDLLGKTGEWEGCSIMSIVALLFFTFIGAMTHKYPLKDHKGVYHFQPIVSLKTNDNIVKGAFFLGSGTIGTESHYFYMVQEGPGGFTRQSVPANSEAGPTLIQETDAMPPGVSWTQCDTKAYGKHDWLIPFGFPLAGPDLWKSRYVIYVPKGTVVQEFRVQ